MTDQEKQVEELKREAVVTRAWKIAREMGATVLFQDFRTGVFFMQIHPSSMSMFDNHIFQVVQG